ncbi:MAG TPA: TRAP transporter permease, partial [Albitalea sp.]|nr:TRAP transporter permease [Albitalea sp.]
GWLAVAYVAFKAVVAICLWAAAAVGYLRAPLSWAERGLAALAAGLLVAAVPWTDQAGFALAAGLAAWHVWRTRRAATLESA